MATKGQKKANENRKSKKANRRPPAFYLIWVGIVVGIIIILALLYYYHHAAKLEAVAIYNGGEITKKEFNSALRLEAGKYDSIVWRDKNRSLSIKQKLLEEILKEHLLLAKARELKIKVPVKEFRAELNSYKSSYTENTFKKMLELTGISYKDWVEQKRRKYLAQKVIEKEVIDKIEITEQEIKDYYKKHKADFSHPGQVRARHIVVSTWETAEEIANELAGGGNFAAIAKKRSISPERWKGGDLGFFPKGIYPEVFDRVCFNTAVGETSQIVKSEYGYHIFKVIDKRGAQTETLEEAKNSITNQLKRDRSTHAFETWYRPIYDAANLQINFKLFEQIEVTIDEEIIEK